MRREPAIRFSLALLFMETTHAGEKEDEESHGENNIRDVLSALKFYLIVAHFTSPCMRAAAAAAGEFHFGLVITTRQIH